MTEPRFHANQWDLIEHLCRFHMLDYPSCLRFLDTNQTDNALALSYFVRPMVRHGYLIHTGDTVKITAKGRALFPQITPLIATGGDMQTQQRVMQVSRVAAWLGEHDIPSAVDSRIPYSQYFIPSACWRKINTAILSTARFAGVLVTERHRLAVYDIGNGTMDWQMRAETSLFRGHIPATGMIFICHPDKQSEIARKIIQQTMWSRKQLLSPTYDQRTKPAQWSKAPIKLKGVYRQVYLTTPDLLGETVDAIERLKETMDGLRGEATCLGTPAQGDFECWPVRIFVNPATDLLKYIYFFAALKVLETWKQSGEHHPLRYVLYAPERDRPIFQMYPKLMQMEEVTQHDC